MAKTRRAILLFPLLLPDFLRSDGRLQRRFALPQRFEPYIPVCAVVTRHQHSPFLPSRRHLPSGGVRPAARLNRYCSAAENGTAAPSAGVSCAILVVFILCQCRALLTLPSRVKAVRLIVRIPPETPDPSSDRNNCFQSGFRLVFREAGPEPRTLQNARRAQPPPRLPTSASAFPNPLCVESA